MATYIAPNKAISPETNQPHILHLNDKEFAAVREAVDDECTAISDAILQGTFPDETDWEALWPVGVALGLNIEPTPYWAEPEVDDHLDFIWHVDPTDAAETSLGCDYDEEV
jgi:hypothetical protein